MALNRSVSVLVTNGDLAKVNDTTPQLMGQVGKVCEAPGVDASPSTKTLAGVYQYVQRATAATAGMVKGNVVFWADVDDFIVTDIPASSIGAAAQNQPAGLALGTLPAAGKYGFIQVAGMGVGLSAAAISTTGFQLCVDVAATPAAIKAQAISTLVDAFIPVVGRALGAVTAATLTIPMTVNFPRVGW
jgi:hypothetical protein